MLPAELARRERRDAPSRRWRRWSRRPLGRAQRQEPDEPRQQTPVTTKLTVGDLRTGYLKGMITLDLTHPDLATMLPLGPYAPRDARHQVGELDYQSIDMRDAIVLLTSELVTRAVWQCESLRGGATAALRAWAGSDVVRVELTGPDGIDIMPRPQGKADFDLMLLDQLADRWSDGHEMPCSCVWFEIDRLPTTPTRAGRLSRSSRRSAASR